MEAPIIMVLSTSKNAAAVASLAAAAGDSTSAAAADAAPATSAVDGPARARRSNDTSGRLDGGRPAQPVRRVPVAGPEVETIRRGSISAIRRGSISAIR